MANIAFNRFGDTTEVDILGDIGDSFFEEGNTLESVKAKFDQIDSTYLVINIASLGGLVSEGLAIHDLIRSYKGHTTAKIIGWTASMGTIVALGADEVHISENSHFLIHNAWTGVVGNSRDLRETAQDLDKIDRRLVGIYKKKTNRPDYEIADLMEQERWLSPEEAIQWGFVDHISTQSKIAASFTDKELIKAGLPKMPENLNTKLSEMNEKTIKDEFASLKDWFVNTFQNKADESVNVLDSKEVQNKLAEFENKANELQEKVDAHQEEIDSLTEAHNAKLSEVEEAHASKVAEFEGKIAEFETTVSELNGKLSSASTDEGGSKAKADPEVGDAPKLNVGQSIIKDLLKSN